MLDKVTILQNVFTTQNNQNVIDCENLLEQIVTNVQKLAYHQNWFSRNVGFSIPKGLQIAACELARRYKIVVNERNLAQISYLLIRAAETKSLDKSSSNIKPDIIKKLHNELEILQDGFIAGTNSFPLNMSSQIKEFDKIYKILKQTQQPTQTGYFKTVINEYPRGYNKTFYSDYSQLKTNKTFFSEIINSTNSNKFCNYLSNLIKADTNHGLLVLYALGINKVPPSILYTKESMLTLLENKIQIKDPSYDSLLKAIDNIKDPLIFFQQLYKGTLKSKYLNLLDDNKIPKPTFIAEGNSKIAFCIKFNDDHIQGFAIFKDPVNAAEQLGCEIDYFNKINALNTNELKEKMLKQSSTQETYETAICKFFYNPNTCSSIPQYLMKINTANNQNERKKAAIKIVTQIYDIMLNNLKANLQHGDLHMNNLIVVLEGDSPIVKQIDFAHRRHSYIHYFASSLVDFFYMLEGRKEYWILNLMVKLNIINKEVLDKHFPDERILALAGFNNEQLEAYQVQKRNCLTNIKQYWLAELVSNETRPRATKNTLSKYFLTLIEDTVTTHQKDFAKTLLEIENSSSPLLNYKLSASISKSELELLQINNNANLQYQQCNFDTYNSTQLQFSLKHLNNTTASDFIGSTFSNVEQNAWLKIYLLEQGCNLTISSDSSLITVTHESKDHKNKLKLAVDVFLKYKLIPMPTLVDYLVQLNANNPITDGLICRYNKLVDLLQEVANNQTYYSLFLACAYFIQNRGCKKNVGVAEWRTFIAPCKNITQDLKPPQVTWIDSQLLLNQCSFPVDEFLPLYIINNDFIESSSGKHKTFFTNSSNPYGLLVAHTERGVSDFAQENRIKQYIKGNKDLEEVISLQYQISHTMMAEVNAEGQVLHDYIKECSNTTPLQNKISQAKALIQQYLDAIYLINSNGIIHNDPHTKNLKIKDNKLQFFDFGNSRCINQKGFNYLGDIQYITNNNLFKQFQQFFSDDETKCRRMALADFFYLVTDDYAIAYQKFLDNCKDNGCIGTFYTNCLKLISNQDDYYDQPKYDLLKIYYENLKCISLDLI